jgi:UDP-galactopyranose mutase
LAPIPCNFDTLELCLGETGRTWVQELSTFYDKEVDLTLARMLNADSASIREIACWIEQNIFRGYSEKQWGTALENLDSSVLSRVPVRLGRDPRYFRDTFQGIPEPGYTELALSILDHSAIALHLGWQILPSDLHVFDTVIYTGSLDDLFHLRLGPLPYRSLRFEYSLLPMEFSQPVAQINFPGPQAYTRVTEFKHLTGEQGVDTLVAREFPMKHELGVNERFYPVKSEASTFAYKNYLALLHENHPNVWPAGRLGDFKYLNMDQAIARGIQVAKLAAR